jgi:peptide/nickel transport system permease protein
VRLVRSIVISVREEAYVEAARSVGTPTAVLLIRHVLLDATAPLIVQGTFISASFNRFIDYCRSTRILS